eukprot:scaffold633_cov288-Ochromonas_danica.AAC.12
MAEIIFTGSKNFWKTKTNLEIVIVFHPSFHLFEIIASDPASPSDEERLYVDYPRLRSKLDHELVEKATLAEQEAQLLESKVVDCGEVQEEVVLRLAKDYLLARLQMTYASPSASGTSYGEQEGGGGGGSVPGWRISLQPAVDDRLPSGDEPRSLNTSTTSDLLCSRPNDLPVVNRRKSGRYPQALSSSLGEDSKATTTPQQDNGLLPHFPVHQRHHGTQSHLSPTSSGGGGIGGNGGGYAKQSDGMDSFDDSLGRSNGGGHIFLSPGKAHGPSESKSYHSTMPSLGTMASHSSSSDHPTNHFLHVHLPPTSSTTAAKEVESSSSYYPQPLPGGQGLLNRRSLLSPRAVSLAPLHIQPRTTLNPVMSGGGSDDFMMTAEAKPHLFRGGGGSGSGSHNFDMDKESITSPVYHGGMVLSDASDSKTGPLTPHTPERRLDRHRSARGSSSKTIYLSGGSLSSQKVTSDEISPSRYFDDSHERGSSNYAVNSFAEDDMDSIYKQKLVPEGGSIGGGGGGGGGSGDDDDDDERLDDNGMIEKTEEGQQGSIYSSMGAVDSTSEVVSDVSEEEESTPSSKRQLPPPLSSSSIPPIELIDDHYEGNKEKSISISISGGGSVAHGRQTRRSFARMNSPPLTPIQPQQSHRPLIYSNHNTPIINSTNHATVTTPPLTHPTHPLLLQQQQQQQQHRRQLSGESQTTTTTTTNSPSSHFLPSI